MDTEPNVIWMALMSVVKFKILLMHLDQLHGKNYPLFTIEKTRIEQCFAVHIVQCCQQYCSALFPLIQARQYCSILFTTMNNVGGKTLFNPIFINREEVIIFHCV